MGLGLSLRQSVHLEQKVQQLLKLELKLELNLVLKQILKILQRLILKNELALSDFHELNKTLSKIDQWDIHNIAHEFVRRTKIEEADTLHKILFFASRQDRDLGTINQFAHFINNKLEEKRPSFQQRRKSNPLAFRFILRAPNFIGGRPGTEENLAILLEGAPQWSDSHDRWEWILAGGWAVEILTGTHLREHHDLDAVLLTPRPLYLDCDVVHTDDYFGVLSCSRLFIERHCIEYREWKYDHSYLYVAVLCPEFLFLSKILRKPRPQDWDDVELLVHHFSKRWNLDLMLKLIRKNNCGFTQARNLMQILRKRDPATIIKEVYQFR